jgi:hypothetical protein
MLNLLLSFTLLLTPDPLFDAVKQIATDEINDCAPRFRLEKRGGLSDPGQIFYLAKGIDDRLTRLNITVHRVPPADLDKMWLSLSPSVGTDGVSAGFSGFSCGSKARRSGGTAGIMMHSHDGVFMVLTQLFYRGQSPSIEARDADKQFLEGLNRRLLSKSRGLQSEDVSPMNVNGLTVASITGPRGERLVDLTRYCQVLNLQLSTNSVLGTASFTAGGEQVIIPLAAKKLKDGPRWIDTTDISLIKDGKWYVSYAALQEARGQ